MRRCRPLSARPTNASGPLPREWWDRAGGSRLLRRRGPVVERSPRAAPDPEGRALLSRPSRHRPWKVRSAARHGWPTPSGNLRPGVRSCFGGGAVRGEGSRSGTGVRRPDAAVREPGDEGRGSLPPVCVRRGVFPRARPRGGRRQGRPSAVSEGRRGRRARACPGARAHRRLSPRVTVPFSLIFGQQITAMSRMHGAILPFCDFLDVWSDVSHPPFKVF